MTLSPEQFDLLAGALAFFFTVALLSYAIGDNALYRAALHIFIGVSAGYVVLVVIFQALVPRLVIPLMSGDLLVMGLSGVPLLLFIFLIFKAMRGGATIGSLPTAYLAGVGTAVAIAGAVAGTLLPLTQATWLSFLPGGSVSPLSALIIVIGTVTTLIYFQFWLLRTDETGEPARLGPMSIAAQIGQGFVVLALGMVYGGIILSGLAVMSTMIGSIFAWVTGLIG